MVKANVLVTGFQPWGKNRRNPSGELARELGGIVLSVDYEKSGRELGRAIRRLRPRALLMFGLAEQRRRIALESVALNLDHCTVAPWRTGPKSIRKGPMALPSRLPLERILVLLKRAQIPADRSFHAGTFICNHVFYLGLALTRVPCGFIHVPPTRVISLERQVRAARIILGSIGSPR